MRRALCIGLATAVAGSAAATTNLEGQVETLGGVDFTHHFSATGDTTWHYVEGGDPNGEPIVFFAGLPESWFSFHQQMIDLAPGHRVIGIDLFGQTVRPASESFLRVDIANDLITLTDSIGLEPANWVSHDWGTVISDALIGLDPDRFLRYARLQAPLHVGDLTLLPQATLFQTLTFPTNFFSNPASVANILYGTIGLDDAVYERLVAELDQTTQNALKAHRLFLDNLPGPTQEVFDALIAENVAYAAAMDLPVLLVQADGDARQPSYFFDGSAGDPTAVSVFTSAPFVDLEWIEGSGHFSELQQPAQVSAAIARLLAVPVPEPSAAALLLAALWPIARRGRLDRARSR